MRALGAHLVLCVFALTSAADKREACHVVQVKLSLTLFCLACLCFFLLHIVHACGRVSILFAPGGLPAAVVRGDDVTRYPAHPGAAGVRVAGGYGQGSRPVSVDPDGVRFEGG